MRGGFTQSTAQMAHFRLEILLAGDRLLHLLLQCLAEAAAQPVQGHFDRTRAHLHPGGPLLVIRRLQASHQAVLQKAEQIAPATGLILGAQLLARVVDDLQRPQAVEDGCVGLLLVFHDRGVQRHEHHVRAAFCSPAFGQRIPKKKLQVLRQKRAKTTARWVRAVQVFPCQQAR